MILFQVVTQQNKQNVDRRGVFALSGFSASGLHSLASSQNLTLPFFQLDYYKRLI